MFRVQNKLFSILGKSQGIFEKSAKEVAHREEGVCRVRQPDQDVTLPLFGWRVSEYSLSINGSECYG